ncbi:MAG: CPBP family intramembrane metalloprotease [Gemmatimonadetes bacterium]|nr:CPBP family intramembrane metalloprotease [Gemmatimonadota bacterium]
MRRSTLAGLALISFLHLTLMTVAGMPLIDTILLAVLLVGLPALAIVQAQLIGESAIERIKAYWMSIVFLSILGLVCWLIGVRNGGMAGIAIVWLPLSLMGLWSLGLTVGCLFTVLLFRHIAARTRFTESTTVRQLFPQTCEEKVLFVVLSAAAGFGEEIAYRGYAIGMLIPLVGLGSAVLVTSVAFGASHVYQGWLGMIRAGLVGGLLAFGVIASGSVWPSVVAHALVNVVLGLVLAEKFLAPDNSLGGREQPELQS